MEVNPYILISYMILGFFTEVRDGLSFLTNVLVNVLLVLSLRAYLDI